MFSVHQILKNNQKTHNKNKQYDRNNSPAGKSCRIGSTNF